MVGTAVMGTTPVMGTMEAAENTMEAADINTMEAVGTVISMDTVMDTVMVMGMVMAGAGGTVTGTAMA